MGNNQTVSMLKIIRFLFLLNAAVWLVFGALNAIRFADEGSQMRLIYAVLMIANAVVMAWFGVMIPSGRNWVFFLGILYMAINVVLSIADQFGWIDALILLLNLIILGLLFVTRGRMNQMAKASPEES
jgi:hypothetical protein